MPLLQGTIRGTPSLKGMPLWTLCAALAALRTPPPRMLAQREVRLHHVARRAISKGDASGAQVCYEKALEPGLGSGRSYLLAALHLVRVGRYSDARDCFGEGILHNREDAKLMQAWGLFESKHGTMRRARKLLERAVVLDDSLSGVLRWSRFRSPTMCLASTSLAKDRAQTFASITVGRQGVAYTIPMANRGWRGRQELGEDPNSWYDAKGPRNGPPMNYWRQAMDERLHTNSMNALDSIIRVGLGGTPTAEAEAPLRELEQKMSIRRPAYNRKLLGVWATIVADGRVVAAPSEGGESVSAGRVGGGCGALQVPATIEIRRDGSRRTKEHRYGTIDENLEEGEQLRITTRAAQGGAVGEDAVQVASAVLSLGTSSGLETTSERELQVDDDRALVEASLGNVFSLDSFPGPIAYLSSYLAVVREQDGRLASVMARVDMPDE